MQAKLPFLRLLSVPPFYTGVPKSATRITDFRLVPIAANPAAAVVSICLKFHCKLSGPDIPAWNLRILGSARSALYFHAPDVCPYCFYVFLSPLLVMGRQSPRCRQVKNMAFVITIIPHLQWFLLLSLVFQPSISFRIMSS